MNGTTAYRHIGAERGRRETAERWLLRAAPDPALALEEWGRGVAVLVAGQAWDAVRVPYAVLDSTFNRGTQPGELRACVARLGLDGPVFCDPYRPFLYFLVPPGTDRDWPRETLARARIECLGGTEPYVHHVGVPRVDRTERPGLFWLLPPDSGRPRHVDAAHLVDVLCERLGQAAREAAREGAR